MTSALILHHYAGSPYSEKIRLLLGYKQLAWHGVAISPVLPKPGLMSLTKGYRRAPVLQIGADIYCDSALIGEEIARRFPTPPLAGGARHAATALLSRLADEDLFWRAVRYAMGLRAEQLPQALLDDRALMHPHMHFERAALAADLPHVIDQLRPVLSLLDAALAGEQFFGGEAPALGDFGLYHPLWFLQQAGGVADLAPDADALHGWMARMAAFGHGRPQTMSEAQAIAAAQGSEPAPPAPDTGDTRIAIGSMLAVMPEGYPREAVHGRLVQLGERRVTIAHDSPQAGLVHVHFPRLGYVVQAAPDCPDMPPDQG